MKSPQLAKLGALLVWLFSISSAMLGLSSIVAFQKMAHEAKGMGKLRLAFGAGICCVPVVWLIFMLLGFYFIGGFQHVNFPCPAARLLTHLTSDHYLLLGTAPSTFADLDIKAL